MPENYAANDTYGTAPDTYTHPDVGAVVTATDPNNDTMTYSLGGTDAGSFDIHQGTGQITVKTATKLNREAKATYMVTVTATDPGGLSDSVDVTIKLTDVDEGPEIERAPLTNQLPPNSQTARTALGAWPRTRLAGKDIGNPVEADGRYHGDTLTYALSGTDSGSFDIDPDTGQLMTLAALDYETKASYFVTVTASDAGGLSDSIDVTITVTERKRSAGRAHRGKPDGDQGHGVQLHRARLHRSGGRHDHLHSHPVRRQRTPGMAELQRIHP